MPDRSRVYFPLLLRADLCFCSDKKGGWGDEPRVKLTKAFVQVEALEEDASGRNDALSQTEALAQPVDVLNEVQPGAHVHAGTV